MRLEQAAQIQIGSHGGVRPRTYGLVLHIQVGNGSLGAYFGNPGNNVSSAYWISKSGRIEQYFDDSLIGWTQADGNSSWIAVETEGFVDEPLTDSQLSAMAVLLYTLSNEYGFPIQNTDDVNGRGLGHHQMGGVAWGNHSCPGPLRIAQKDEIVRRARSIGGTTLSGLALGGTPLSEEDDMPYSEEQIIGMVAKALRSEGVSGAAAAADPDQMWDNRPGGPNGTITGYGPRIQKTISEEVAKSTRSEGITAGVAALLARSGSASSVDAAAQAKLIADLLDDDLAGKVADLLAKRMQA